MVPVVVPEVVPVVEPEVVPLVVPVVPLVVPEVVLVLEHADSDAPAPSKRAAAPAAREAVLNNFIGI